MTPEKKVQNSIINYLQNLQDKEYPLFYDRRSPGAPNYKKGIPDLYCVYNGIHIEIEVKQEKGSLSSMQEKWRDRFKKWNIFWVCPLSFEEFKSFFENIIKNNTP